jgi:hypothetical protein
LLERARSHCIDCEANIYHINGANQGPLHGCKAYIYHTGEGSGPSRHCKAYVYHSGEYQAGLVHDCQTYIYHAFENKDLLHEGLYLTSLRKQGPLHNSHAHICLLHELQTYVYRSGENQGPLKRLSGLCLFTMTVRTRVHA